MEEDVGEGLLLSLPPELWDYVLSFLSRNERIVASHVNHTWRALALSKDKGLVLTSGCAARGQLGRTNNKEKIIGLVAPPLQDKVVVQVAAGDSFTIVLTNKGQVWTFGATLGESSSNSPEPRRLNTNRFIVQIAAGRGHALLAADDGTVLSVGDGHHGQLGHGERKNLTEPQVIEKLLGLTAKHMAVGSDHSLVATTSDQVFGFGGSAQGQLGEKEPTSLFKELEFFRSMKVLGISAGEFYSMVLTDNGLYSFGATQYGNLGRQNSEAIGAVPASAFNDETVIKVASGYFHTVALTASGKVYSWGNNYWGKLGNGGMESENIYTPALVKTLESVKVVQIAAATRHSIAVTAKGEVYMWGCNKDQQHGIRDEFVAPFAPRPIPAFNGLKILQVACGKDHSVILVEIPVDLHMKDVQT